MRCLLRHTPVAVLVVVFGLAVGLPRAGAVINGTPDAIHQNVGLMYVNDIPALSIGLCSGSLIAADEFLVAGHCTATLTAFGLTPDQVSVTFDQKFWLTEEGVITAAHPLAVTGWDTHPDYANVGYPFSATTHTDVGVIHLAQDVTGVTPVALPPVGFLDEKRAAGELRRHTLTVSGYGFNGTDRAFLNPNNDLVWDMQREYGPDLFQSLTQDRLHDVGPTCAGDSGAPFFYGGDYPNLVVAVGSTGPASCSGPGSQQRLDTQTVHDWLAQFTQ